jgi:MFS transporter, OFA family, oxalate/formate antiporter
VKKPLKGEKVMSSHGVTATEATNSAPVNTTLAESNRWLFVMVGFLISLVLGLLYAWSIFVIPLEKQFGWTRAQTSLAFTISIIFFVVGMIAGGKHTDKKGPRVVVSIGSLVLAAGFFLASLTNSLIHLYLSYGVLCGFGIGYANIAPMVTAMRWFPDRRGLVSGILVMGFGLAAFVLGSTAGYIIAKVGWEWAFRLFAILSLLFCLLGAQFMKYPPPGWLPDGMRHGSAATGPARKTQDYDWRQMFRTSTWWIWWTFHLAILTGGLMIIGHIVPFAVESGVSTAQAVFAMGVFSVCNGLGRVAVGLLWDNLGRNRTMIIAGVIMFAGLLSLGTLVSQFGYAAMLVAVVLIGASFGGAVPIASSLIASSFGNKHFGTNYGIATTPLMVGAIIGPYLGGYIRTLTNSYEIAIFTSAALAIIGIITGIIIKDPKPKTEA